MSTTPTAARPEIPAQPDPNDASGVLFGLTLALTAPTDAQAAKAAQITVDIYNRSTLTADDLETLKAAAVVIFNAEGGTL
tara:strand:+ start:1275 stop:1514 length:240 start_codon:yes stop_codon:yes gene_type:complete